MLNFRKPTQNNNDAGNEPLPGDGYVHTTLMSGLSDVFSPDALWSPAKVMSWGQRGLKGLVEAMSFRHGAGEQVPTSVILELPADKVEWDRRIGGQLTSELVAALVQRHSSAFGDRMPKGVAPRYAVLSARDVPAGHVRVRMGPAIHVPQAGEPAVWKLQTSLDGVVWDATPPALLTETQRLFILAGSVAHGSQVCPQWPFAPHLGLVVLNQPGESRLDLSAEPLGGLHIGHNEAAGCYVLHEASGLGGAAGTDDGPCLYLRTTRLVPLALPDLPSRSGMGQSVQPPVPRVQPVALSELPASLPGVMPLPSLVAPQLEDAGEEDAPTLVATPAQRPAPDAEPQTEAEPDDAPTLFAVRVVPSATLTLEGLALQRPSQFSAAGVKGVQWGLDASGGVVAPAAPACVLRFAVDATDTVSVSTAAGQRKLVAGDAVPLKGGSIVLRLQALPEPLGEFYIGWLQLPLGQPVRLAHGLSVGVGRQLESLKPLQPLAGPGFLTDVPATSGDRMGLSRRHFELQASPEGLVVRALGTSTVAHLDAQMRHMATITAEKPALLADGHCMVVGHYVWRFNE